MPDTIWEEFWWNNIAGPNNVVTQVAEALLSKSIVELVVPSDLPWRHQMRHAIKSEFKRKSAASGIIVHSIDVKDDCPNCDNVGRFLLKQFAKDSIQKGYREKSGLSIQKYIIENRVLHNLVVWVKGLDIQQATAWMKFCKDYATNELDNGLFVIETHKQIPGIESKRLKVIDFSKNVSSYDVQLFNSLILDERKTSYNRMWKKYIATVAALLCDTDAEVSKHLILNTNFKKENPINGIQQISEHPDFSRRGCETSDSYHVLKLFRSNCINELENKIWEAQIQVLFPLIEMDRVKFVERWKDEIETALQNNQIQQYGQVIHDASEAELVTLDYMTNRRNTKGEYYLHIPDPKEREKLQFLHECRNLLAHACCCTPEQIQKLFDR